MVFVSVNPATDIVIDEYPIVDRHDAWHLANRVHKAFETWKLRDNDHRAGLLKKVASLLRERKREYGRIISLEMGKPLTESVGELEKCAWVCDYYAEVAAKFLEPQPVETDAAKSFISLEPLGTVLAIMPWNFPFWQVFRFGAPALMAGNTFILKHAPNVTGCALAIETVFRDAGFPADVCRVLLADVDIVAELIAHPRVRAVTLTGSTRAGRSVAEIAGRNLKKTVLELGGSDPYLILEDADIVAAAEACVTSRLLNAGQSCIAAKRFIAVGRAFQPFQDAVIALMRSKTMGDPLAGQFDLGPMARKDLRDGLHDQVKRSTAKGDRLVLGGKLQSGPGCFYPPTVLTGVTTSSPAFREELFGPVAAIIAAKDEEEAIALANDSSYGLGAAVFTADREHGEQLAQRLQAGACFVNDFVRSDPRLPFGGTKDSGYGRELSSHGIREFVNIKTVYLR